MGITGNPFRDRPPSPTELLRFQLLLATFKDGSGNLKMPDGSHRADWRQVERCFAEAFQGVTAESKAVFDVDVVPVPIDKPYGLSIKTSLRRKDDKVLLELNNSPAKMLQFALTRGAARDQNGEVHWNCTEEEMGHSIVAAVESWHDDCRVTHDVDRSSYVVMTHDRLKLAYEVLWLDLALGDPSSIQWEIRGRALVGVDGSGARRWEFYKDSGGQVKWYPDGSSARWRSGLFGLPDPDPLTLSEKAEDLFPEEWSGL